MNRPSAVFAIALTLTACSASQGGPRNAAAALPPLKVANWNLQFLAERNDVGCQPRTDSDYQAMRRIANSLDADVIAFQEAENPEAAVRVFDPARYDIVMRRGPEARPAPVAVHKDQRVIRQAVEFAVRKGVSFDRKADVTSLTLGNAQLRSGIDITLRPDGRAPLRLLGIHLKSGCFSGDDAKACATLQQQVPALEAWIDAAAAGPDRFIVLGDWNRRLGLTGDVVWTEIDDEKPANADLRLADQGISPKCDPRYDSFSDHIVLDKRAGADMLAFSETLYAPGEAHYSDHCPVMVTLAR